MARKFDIAVGEHYHIYNRGNDKQLIFRDERDWTRFLFLILYFQSPLKFGQVGRHVSHYVKHRGFDIQPDAILEKRYVELVAFTLMPNHFHLIVSEITEKGISEYLRALD